MHEYIKYGEGVGAQYVEIKHATSQRDNIEISNKHIKEISSGINSMLGVRVIFKDRWGTAFSNKDNIEETINQAIKNAKANKQKTRIDTFKANKRSFKTKVKTDPANIPFLEKQNSLLKINRIKSVTNLSQQYTDITRNFGFFNSEGSELRWDDKITFHMVSSSAKKNNRIENYFDVKAEHKGYELMDDAENFSLEIMKKSVEMLRARNANGGTYPVLIDQKLGGVLIHEALGHACEADIVLNNNSVLGNKLNEQVGSANLNVYDAGNIINSWGWTPFDDEGILAKKTPLIRKGVLTNFLHNRETAAKFKVNPTGNGRAQSPSNKVIPRMTNTFIDKGESRFDDMLSSIKEGYYLKGSLGGEVESASGQFLFNAQEGFLIKNGQLIKRVKGVSLTGNILETLKNICLIGDDPLIHGGGACGKAEQYVLAGNWSPHIKIKNTLLGGQN